MVAVYGYPWFQGSLIEVTVAVNITIKDDGLLLQMKQLAQL